MKEKKRILICPLNWGLGHASRCIPIVQTLLLENHTVIIAASGAPLSMLRQEFPSLLFVEFGAYTIRYSKRFFTLNLLMQVPKIIFGIISENFRLKKICTEHTIDIVISDNRYGCWNPRLHSVFITHQIFIPSPIFNKTIRRINFWFMSRYDQVWIPDFRHEDNLSGKLSHGKPLPKNVKFIGPLSRFYTAKTKEDASIQYKICVVLSGPEPQRTLLEQILLDQISRLQTPSIIIRGLPKNSSCLLNTEHIEFVNHLNKEALLKVLNTSEIIICRSGYSSIMDLWALGKKAILIPTPGQKEQEYLASYLSQRSVCFSASQNGFDLLDAIKMNSFYAGFEGTQQTKLNIDF